MSRLIITLIIGLVPLVLLAQESETGKVYFDKHWEKTSSKSKAKYYRKWKKLEANKYLINDYYMTGELQMKVLSKDPIELKKFGKCTWYSENGNVSRECDYVDNERHGVCKSYFESGELESIDEFDEGDFHGNSKGYYKDGSLKYERKYLADDREGDWVYYYKNGAKAETISYKDDKPTGERLGFFSDGAPKYFQKYDKDGNEIGSFWIKHKNGEFEVEGQFDDGEKSGTWTRYYDNGKVRCKGNYKNDKRNGEWLVYYKEGNIRVKLFYEEGELNGKCTWYYENGNVSVIEKHKPKKEPKRQGFDLNGNSIKPELIDQKPILDHSYLKDFLESEYGSAFKQRGVKHIGLLVELNDQNEVDTVEIIGARFLNDSTLEQQIAVSISKLEWNSRTIMNEQKGSRESFLFNISSNGKVEKTYANHASQYLKYGYMPSWTRRELDDESDDSFFDTYTIVEEMPQFPGGDNELFAYLGQNMRYPPEAKEKGIQGVVYLNFVVDEFGNITDARVIRGIGKPCDLEALRVIEGFPTWKPGFQNGKPVKVSYNLPVRFILRG